MYEKFKNAFLAEMQLQGIDLEVQQKVLRCLNVVAVDYSIGPKENSLVPYTNPNEQVLFYYLSCRAVEGMAKTSINGKRIILRNFFAGVGKPFDQVTALDVRAYLYNYQDERKIQNRSLEALRSAIRAFYEWCLDEGYMTSNPCKSISPIKYEKKQRPHLTPLELEYLRKACITKREKAYVNLLYSTACRISELLNMKITDIDMVTKEADVLGKGNKHRTVYLNPRAYIALKEYLEERGDDGCEYVLVAQSVSDKAPHQMHRRVANNILSEIAARTPIKKKVTPHIIRHTTATLALNSGMPIDEVSMMLGHARLETTMIYAETDKEMLKSDHKRCII